MKFNKALLIVSLLVTALGFSACDNNDDYVPGAFAGEHNIGFDSEENLVMGMTDTEISVVLTRANTEGELTIPLQALMVPECMTMPKSVTFADGSATADVKVSVSEEMKTFTEYQLSFRIPEEYSNAYAADGKSPIFNITVKKEDFKVVANGVFNSAFWFEDSWEQDLEYSPILGLFRIPNCYAEGSHWYFLFDGADNFTFCDNEGTPVDKFLSGFVHPSYGEVSVTVLGANPMGYVTGIEDWEGVFRFPLQFTVSAGSFGAGYEYYYVSNWQEKPWETNAE